MDNNARIKKAIDFLQSILLQNDEKDELQLEIQEFLKTTPIVITVSEDEFYKEFNCIKNHLDDNASFDGCMFETFGKEVEYIKNLVADGGSRAVWTIIEAEGKFFFISGYHVVNRFGYLVTNEPVQEGLEIEVELDNEIDGSIPEAQFTEEIVVIDPDSKGEVHLAVFKHQNGGMFAVDSSYLEQEFEDDNDPLIPDPLEKTDNPVVILKGT